jgi:transglutaminase-like putative cysteine protease
MCGKLAACERAGGRQQMEKYLRATPAIDCDSKSIKEKAESLIQGREGVAEKAKCLFYFVRDEIRYNPYLSNSLLEQNRASATLERGKGYCVQKAVLLAALARAVGIPARLGFADIRNHIIPKKLMDKMGGENLFLYHGYDELFLGGKWVKATPAFDLRMCQENRIIPVEFDGESDATFHRYNLDGKLHIEYIRDHGHYHDLPLDEILEARHRFYHPEQVK